ncbi:RHS repeat domain-containing protein [Chryseobacterium gambrini]|uniref:hypothetical protein n=1 Tax=Chryseobacterium gambrini TaxID=373672 RepID=UPI0022F1BFED|nr:hypothetical protein [Chryseobacterium gambrini]WBV54134.1 hypothetical protein PFY09_07330 [Chryseobacterium gambrini]
MRKMIILSTFFTIKSLVAQQNYNQYYVDNLPKPPSIKMLEKYGAVTNSEYTGSNSFSIPLANIESGDIKIPIVLKYISGNGIKVRDEASNVGLGWGIPFANITQDVQGGLNDLEATKKLKLTFLYDSTPPVIRNRFAVCDNTSIPSQYLLQPNEDRSTFFKINWNLLPVDNVFKNYNTSVTDFDTAPDIFTCNLFGEKLIFVTSNFQTISGTGFTPTFKCLNKKGYKIDYNTSDLFIITNPFGIKYYFSKNETYSLDASDSVGKNFVITKIVDKNNNTINFTYDELSNVRFIPFYSQNLNYTQSYSGNVTSLDSFGLNWINPSTCNLASGGQGDEYKIGDINAAVPYYGGQTGTFVVPPSMNGGQFQNKILAVKSISGNFGTVMFNYSNRVDYTDNRKLDEITIKNTALFTTKKINFLYSYFNSSSSITVRDKITELNILNNYPTSITQDQLSKRLKLDALIINDVDQYTFTYNTTPLVDKDSFAVDYWGFYNGGINNSTLFANPTDFVNNPIPLGSKNNNKKIADINYTKAGILEKVIYPTKGYTTFNYELNSGQNFFLNNDFSPNQNTGNGLRLREQINYDNTGTVSEKYLYSYEGGQSITPLDLFKKYKYKYAVRYNSGPAVQIYNFESILSSVSVSDNISSPLSSGNYFGYSTVIKKEVDGNNNSKGKTVTTYYNNQDIPFLYKDDNIPVYIPALTSKNPENGLVKSVELYDNNNTLLKKTANNYNYVFSDFFYGASVLFSNTATKASTCSFQQNDCPQNSLTDHPIAVCGFYPIFSKESLLTSSVTTQYINNKEFITQNNYGYNSNNNLSSQVAIFPDGSSESSTLSYAQEANQQKLLNANMISVPLFKTTSRGSQDYSSALTKYDDPVHLNPTSVVSGSQYSDMGSENKTEVTYDKYDSRGNLLQYTTKEGIPTTIIWGYNQTQPIASIIGIKLSDISQALINSIVTASNTDASAAPGNDESAFLALLDTFRKDPSMAGYQVTTYTYDPLIGVRSITPSSGIREVYLYDSANRLKEIRENNQTGNILKEFKYNYKN